MVRRSKCYANSHAEPFWSHFKVKLLDGGHFHDLAEAKLEVSHHIACNNAERRHSALDYLALNQFVIQLNNTSLLCLA
ncbi:hypothetical protein GCM10023185_40160 [Hymenobacter saemangeumensis]|uniref:Integrase catalytic domain-containing protein n=1 Tax=Hymenobacter saemangeumensis TaxID=1084522 RepID=A0ABP8IR35_9BACT